MQDGMPWLKTNTLILKRKVPKGLAKASQHGAKTEQHVLTKANNVCNINFDTFEDRWIVFPMIIVGGMDFFFGNIEANSAIDRKLVDMQKHVQSLGISMILKVREPHGSRKELSFF